MDLRDELDFPLIDFHVHTNEQPSWGSIPVTAVAKKASRRGLRCIALTDHWKLSTDPAIFLDERKEIDKINVDLKIFLSAEVEVLDAHGNTPVDAKAHRRILEKMDYLSAAPHHGEFLPNSLHSLVGKEDLPKDKVGIIEYAHRKLMNILENNMFDYVLHPWVTVLADLVTWGYSRVPSFEDIPEKYLDEFVESAAFHKKGIEIYNPSAEMEGYDFFIKKLIRAGVKIAVGSDSHEDSGHTYPGKVKEAADLIRKCGGDKRLLWLPKGF